MLGTIAKDANALYKLFEGKGGCDFSCIAKGVKVCGNMATRIFF